MTSPPTKRSASPSSAMASRALSSVDPLSQNPENGPNDSALNNSNNSGLAPPRARPPARSNFDLEPNPFEHSFSSTSNVSQDTPKQEGTSGNNSNGNHADPVSNNATNNNGHDQNGSNSAGNGPSKHGRDVKPMLPPLAALESPADHGFGSWGLASSLRSGPLSPAMLAGPASQQTPSLGLGAFDSSFVRTGLTPDVNRTGLTPLIGGPGGFPPPSPNTAALFALVNGTSSSSSLAPNVAITPGTLNAITGVLGGHSMGGMHQPTSMSLDAQNHQQLVDQAQQQHQQQQQQHQQGGGQYHPHDSYSHDSASHAISNAASALYLLSQQQNLQRHQGQGQVNPSAVSGVPQQQQQHQQQAQAESPTATANPSSLATRRAPKRKTLETPAPAPRGKKAKPTNAASTRGVSRRKTSKNEDFDDDMEEFDEDDEDDDMYTEGAPMMPLGMGGGSRSSSTAKAGGGGNRKPETEEEKRKNFLERNRQAALKCRQRKKAWLTALQAKVEFLTTENERLTGALVTSREEIARLSQAVVAQGGAPSAFLSEQSPITLNAGHNSIMGDGGSSVTSERERRNSTTSSTGAAHHQQQPVHVNVNVAMPNMPNVAPATNGMGHAHSHSMPQNQQTQGRGHARAHSHGHNHVPANGVTVGGRGYGY